ncbi:hypothetical protein INT08_10810 [Prosthecochloris sp. N3]|uniref:Chlorosome envelope protein B n=1 Tax=Prosthecochloris ethylica TaxID=2743976 RepID=A0ABR9XUV2_9CHLB|nr:MULTISPECIES: hypothetical protein [Prosthecochloris]MEC9487104.1 hypothetical protein [Prosthecochloris sp.]MBF0587385.1 hypothetical protein [Prosthecochloris ethylica]MBF0637658.1 hypothetical protein [Prosthecochloris ethylica]NUK48278.1 hypothetical protein [Prosthecochloris ethylica]RNA71483.1 hypothetical protein CR163_000045 [Prosthecochloris sp. ZM_2]
MAEEMKSQGQAPQAQSSGAGAKSGGSGVKGDFSTILVGVGTLLDSTLTPLSKAFAQTLESMNGVAKQILEGVSKSFDNKGGQ